MTASFIHLRVHTEYSLADGTLEIIDKDKTSPLMNRAVECGMPALAITDIGNFFALVKFYLAAEKAGIKPIIGVDVRVQDQEGGPETWLTLLARNNHGYENLKLLISKAYLDGQQHGVACVLPAWVVAHAEGLIALSGGVRGDIGIAMRNGRDADAEVNLRRWMKVFPDAFYPELQRTGRPGEEDYVHAAMALAQRTDCPVVATNEVCFMQRDDFDAHEVRVCISAGRTLSDPRRDRQYSPEQYFKTPEEMCALFADIPEALENSVEIALRCNVVIELGKPYLPIYPVPAGLTEADFFAQLSRDGLALRWQRTPLADAEKKQAYLERLEFEINMINRMGFAGYFLIVMDFIRWAKNNGVPVGPGRGSGAGSLVAYALEITDIDPLLYDLLFERFLNPERVSMPDFDVDFCMDGRDRVIAYVAEKYGREAVSQIITFGTMAAKAVVRDVARVQGKSYGLADKLSKMIPFEVGMTLEKAYAQEEPLRQFLQQDADAQEIWDMAKQLEGITRNVGKHAGGVVIAPTKLTDFSALYCDSAGEGVVTQFDKDDVEKAGLVKFDFLGLRTLTIIDWTRIIIDAKHAREGLPPFDITHIPLDDAPTFAMLKRAETTAVFQLESHGMKELIKKLLPSCFEDIIALVALFRPGPLQSGMVDDFVNRKHGRQAISYPHPALVPVLSNTYGVIVYQEQVMQIAQVLAGYTLGGADMLRRAMGKKDVNEMAKQRQLFLTGAQSQGVAELVAGSIFDLMEKFAEYGFNKSHSAAYAMVSYQTAWLKTHYPAEFMAAVLSSDMDNTDKVVTLIEECRAMGLTVRPPDVNEGHFRFAVNQQGAIIYGLGAIKGLGEGPVDCIMHARQQGEEFRDLFDFCARVDARKVNKRALDALIRSGALDLLGPQMQTPDFNRAVLLAAMPEAVQAAEQAASNSSRGMGDLFGEVVSTTIHKQDAYADYLSVRHWSARARLAAEKETLGLYLTGHPIDEYEQELRRFVPSRIASLRAGPEQLRIAGLVVSLVMRKNRKGDPIATLVLDDRSGRMEVTLFSEALQQHRERLVKDSLLVIEGKIVRDAYRDAESMRATGVQTLLEARQSALKAIRLHLNGKLTDGFSEQLAGVLSPWREGACPVLLACTHPAVTGELRLGDDWKVVPDDDLLRSLREWLGRDAVELVYQVA